MKRQITVDCLDNRTFSIQVSREEEPQWLKDIVEAIENWGIVKLWAPGGRGEGTILHLIRSETIVAVSVKNAP